MKKIVMTTSDPGFEEHVRTSMNGSLDGSLLRLEGGWDDAGLDALMDEIVEHAPRVLAIGPGVNQGRSLALAGAMGQHHPEIEVVLVTKPTPKLRERAMAAGVRTILPPDAAVDEVKDVFDRVLAVVERRRENLNDGDSTAANAPHVISVISPKGGAGKSMVATNVAVSLARAVPEQVVLVDLDLQFGDVAGSLQLNPDHTIVDAARMGPDIDITSLKVFLTPHPSGAWVLAGPLTPVEAEEITPDVTQAIVERLSEEFRFVIIDTSAGIDEHTLAAIEVSTDFVLVSGMDVPSVRAIRKEVDALDQLGMLHQRRHFVLNRADTRVGLDAGDVEATVGLKVDIAVPSSRGVPISVNQGRPIVDSDPRSPVTKQLEALAARFAPVPTAKPAGRFGRRR